MSLHTPRRCARATASGVLALTAALGLGACSETTGVEGGVTVQDIQEDDASPGFNGTYDRSFYGGVDDYAGETVTLSADVGQVISDNAFTIAGGDVEELLIVSAEESVELDEGSVIEVTGTVYQSFHLSIVEDRLGADLDDDLFDPYDREPYIQATGIKTNADLEGD